jgi:MFS family permease
MMPCFASPIFAIKVNKLLAVMLTFFYSSNNSNVQAFFPSYCSDQGSLEMFTGLGLILGPPLGGWLYQAYGYELPFLVLGCILLLMVPFNIIVMPSCGRRSSISVHKDKEDFLG